MNKKILSKLLLGVTGFTAIAGTATSAVACSCGDNNTNDVPIDTWTDTGGETLTPSTPIGDPATPLTPSTPSNPDATAFAKQVDAWVIAAQKVTTNYKYQTTAPDFNTFMGVGAALKDPYGYSTATNNCAPSNLINWDQMRPADWSGYDSFNLSTESSTGTIEVVFRASTDASITYTKSITVNIAVQGVPEFPSLTPSTPVTPTPLPYPTPSTSNYFQYINETAQGSGTNQMYVPTNPQNGVTFNNASSWYDTGFSWYELLNRPWYTSAGVPDPTQGSTYLSNILKNQNMMNLGFITAYDAKQAAAKAAAEPSNNYVKLAMAEAAANPNMTLPTISGTLAPTIVTNTQNWNREQKTNLLQEIRNAGGDYKVSFGGWNNYTLAGDMVLNHGATAKNSNDVNNLYNLYKSVVQAYNAKYLDFDIEGAESGQLDDFNHTPLNVQQQSDARDLRIAALTKLKADFPYLNITWTLPTTIGGIENPLDIQMIMAAQRGGFMDKLNIMAFDFGTSGFIDGGKPSLGRITAPGEMALYSISAANAVHQQLMKELTLGSDDAFNKLGLTFMNGRTDVAYQVAWTVDAQILTNYAIYNHLGAFSNWSMNKDLSQWARDDYSYKMGDYPVGYVPSVDHLNVQPLTTAQLLSMANANTKKLPNGDDTNVATVDAIGTKDFTYTNFVKNYASNTTIALNNTNFNSDLFNNVDGIKSFQDIQDYTGVLQDPIKMTSTPAISDPYYTQYINGERSNTTYYFANPQSFQSTAMSLNQIYSVVNNERY